MTEWELEDIEIWKALPTIPDEDDPWREKMLPYYHAVAHAAMKKVVRKLQMYNAANGSLFGDTKPTNGGALLVYAEHWQELRGVITQEA